MYKNLTRDTSTRGTLFRARSSAAERTAHNRLIAGSNPAGPTIDLSGLYAKITLPLGRTIYINKINNLGGNFMAEDEVVRIVAHHGVTCQLASTNS
jgi:hypothetical protein